MIRHDLSNRDYHALDAISKSGLDLIAKSPKHFKQGGGRIGAETARIGTFTHAQILEDGEGLIIAPDWSKQSNDDRDSWRDWFADYKADVDTTRKAGLPAAEWFGEFEKQTGQTIVKESELEMCKQIKQSIFENQDAADLLSDGVAEASILQTYNHIDIRCRPDWMIQKSHTLVDLKSTESAERWKFRNSVKNFRYHVQDQFYSLIYHLEFGHWPDFKFIAVEKTEPFTCVVYELDDKAKTKGNELMERDLETYKQCMDSGVWPGIPNDYELDIPIYGDGGGTETVDNLEELMA